MNAITPLTPFVTALSEVPAAIERLPDLPDERRRSITADVATFIRLQPSAGSLPPTKRFLGRPLADFIQAAAAHGITRKRAANIASNVRAATKLCGGSAVFRGTPLSPEWQALMSLSGLCYYSRLDLARLAKWGSSNFITPQQVDDVAIADFHVFLKEQHRDVTARAYVSRTVSKWNKFAGNIEMFPVRHLSGLAWNRNCSRTADFAPSFIADLEGYTKKIRGTDALSDEDPVFDENNSISSDNKIRRKTTCKTRSYALRQAAARLADVRQVDLKSITSLADLLAPGAIQAIATKTFKDLGQGNSLASMIDALMSVAHHYLNTDPTTVVRLMNINSKIKRKKPALSEKNRRLIREISPRDIAELHSIPNKLRAAVMARINAGLPLRKSEIKIARAAVCLSILLYTPIRINNFTHIKIGDHITLPDRRGGTARLRFSADEMKGGSSWDCPIHRNSLPTILWYVNIIRPLIARDSEYLFPGKRGPINSHTIWQGLGSAIKGHFRVYINPHFFRHLVAHMMLVRDPGNYEAVRQLLAHAGVKITKAYYCGEEAEAALQHVARCLGEAAAEIAAMAKKDRRSTLREIIRPVR